MDERPVILRPDWRCLHCGGVPLAPDREGIIRCGRCRRPIAALGDPLCAPFGRRS